MDIYYPGSILSLVHSQSDADSPFPLVLQVRINRVIDEIASRLDLELRSGRKEISNVQAEFGPDGAD